MAMASSVVSAQLSSSSEAVSETMLAWAVEEKICGLARSSKLAQKATNIRAAPALIRLALCFSGITICLLAHNSTPAGRERRRTPLNSQY